ncbi:helix-turn-helix domain-containing protein [Faecalibaculum rodentium]|uniref:helix-turn-helix domain-containing protein n=1 Tax=Faecalibaculum rodentium TaxID=1702221 RepID=UPI002602175E|nr:XRE family transcriptional regulator [Faecalibaculum rodentium]
MKISHTTACTEQSASTVPRPGSSLKFIRRKRGLSLEQVSILTGVSRPMLSQIEREASVPTISTLWKIASGLQIPLSSLLQEPERRMQKVVPDRPVEAEDGRMKAWLLFPFDPNTGTEIWRVSLEPGCVHSSPPHAGGTEETILLEHGTLVMTAGDSQEMLEDLQALRFMADVDHSYQAGGHGCRFMNIIQYHG